MKQLIELLMAANDNSTINEIVWQNQEMLDDNPALYIHVRNARKRVALIYKQLRKCTPIYEMN